jgi:erythronate-4-phosphate dehydrogenase
MHTPLTKDGPDATYHLADETFFDSMKQGAFFLNTSRGKVQDEAALKKAMQSGKLGGVVLDVWETEPKVDPWLMQNVDLST